MSTTRRRTGVAFAAGVIAVAGLSACGGDDDTGANKDTGRAAVSSTPAADDKTSGDLQSQYEKVVRDVLPSVVQINTDTGLGSGVVYDDKGHIVTNAHVVGSATTFQVTLPNASKPVAAKLVASFAPDDLAVIVLDDPPDSLKPASFGDSGKLEVGQITMAMGSPLGLDSSVTEGIVSAVGRIVSEPQTQNSPGATISSAIQTSAAINPGNSGGALVDLKSQVIGIPTLAATDPDANGSTAPGIGFAIPSNTVKSIADQIIKDGKVVNSGKAALGVTVRTVADASGQGIGVGVVSVQDGGAAKAAGIQAGELITAIGDVPITDTDSLSEAIGALKPGDKVKVTVIRSDGDKRTVDVTLGELKS